MYKHVKGLRLDVSTVAGRWAKERIRQKRWEHVKRMKVGSDLLGKGWLDMNCTEDLESCPIQEFPEPVRSILGDIKEYLDDPFFYTVEGFGEAQLVLMDLRCAGDSGVANMLTASAFALEETMRGRRKGQRQSASLLRFSTTIFRECRRPTFQVRQRGFKQPSCLKVNTGSLFRI